jgi:biotin/methionine sulfoxide reductase
VPEPSEHYVAFEQFRQDPVANPLQTRSGKVEIFSETVAGYGYDDCPGHPVWLEPKEWLGGERAASFPLHLISNQPENKLHSQLDDGPFSRATKIGGREPALMHPQDAQARGLTDGDLVRVFNDRGATLACVSLSERIRPGVIRLATGAWYDPARFDAKDPLEKHGNPNVLTPDRGTSRLAQGPIAHSALVQVERYDGEVPEVTAFQPPVIITA